MAHVEFTIEPFVEGRLGPHVTAAIAAVESHGLTVEMGPFGSAFSVDLSAVGAVVGEVTEAALANGASHVTVHVARDAPNGPSAFAPPLEAS